MTTRLSASDALAAADALAAVQILVEGLVSSERQCAADSAATLLETRGQSGAYADGDKSLPSFGANMLAAKLEVEKWLPLLNALMRYQEAGTVGGPVELERVWMPVYISLRDYIAARERSLMAAAGADRPVPHPPEPTSAVVACTKNAGAHSSPPVMPRATGGDTVSGQDSHIRRSSGTTRDGEVLRPTTPDAHTRIASAVDVPIDGAPTPSVASDCHTGSGPLPSPAAHAELDKPSGHDGQSVKKSGRDGHCSTARAAAAAVGALACDRESLEETLRTFRQATFDMDGFCQGLVSAIDGNIFSSEERVAALQSAACAARVSCAIDAVSFQISKQIVALDMDAGVIRHEPAAAPDTTGS